MRKAALALAAVLLAHPAGADEVRFTLTVDYPLLRAAVARELGFDANGQAQVWGSPGGCRSLVVRALALAPAEQDLRVEARGTARLGFGVLGFCLAPVTWEGWVDTLGTPVVGPDWQLRLRDLRSQLLDEHRRPTFVARRIWDAVESRYEDRLGAFAYDLGPPVAEARRVIEACVAPERAARIAAVLDTLHPVGVEVATDGIRVAVALDVAAAGPEPTPAEPPLAPADIARWEAALERWDGFLVFVVKNLAGADPDPAVRDRLFGVLMRSRRAFLAALAAGSATGADPVRELFLTAWDELRATVRTAALHGALDSRALRYLAFVTAGDALAALDRAAPSLDLEISADGLRRLARVLDPDAAGDPLAYSETPDAVLRDLFGFHEPESAPAPTEPPESRWWWPAPRAAHAADVSDIDAVARRLARWVPEPGEIDEYRDGVGRLLTLVSARTADVNGIEARFRGLYPDVVRTTAWQESCWRQFVRDGDRVTFLLSRTGDIGLMQVNRRVWRGFFDVEKLEWDIAYNAGAGAEILAQLLRRYGAREAGTRLENAARATYAAYNGGPDAYRRWRQRRVPRRLRAIDAAFWEKFQAMTAGGALDYVLCVAEWPGGHARLSTVPLASTPKCSIRSRSSRATSTIVSRHVSRSFRPRARFV